MATVAENHAKFNMFMDSIRKLLAVKKSKSITLGNVEFFVSEDDPFKGELCYSEATHKWDIESIRTD